MGTFSRLRFVIAANINALLEKAEDPEKLLRALIREMEEAGEEARAAGAELLSERRHLNRRLEEQNAGIDHWHARAERAVAENRDDLARSSLIAKGEAAARRDALQQELGLLESRLAELDADTARLKQKLAEAKSRLKNLLLRPTHHGHRGAIAPPVSLAERRVRRAFGRFDRLQAQVENLEARVQSYETGGPAPRVWVTDAVADPAVTAELEQLKQRLAEDAGTPVAAGESARAADR